MIKVSHGGDFKHTEGMLRAIKKLRFDSRLKRYGEAGVEALRNSTPVDTGATANAWGYEINSTKDSVVLQFTNSNLNDGVNIAILIQYGHGTGTGGFVMGRDYINPAVQPLFDKIADDIWGEVTNH